MTWNGLVLRLMPSSMPLSELPNESEYGLHLIRFIVFTPFVDFVNKDQIENTYAIRQKRSWFSMIFVNYEECTGCGVCMESCEFDAILLQNDKATIDQEKCEGCQACIEACPPRVIKKKNDRLSINYADCIACFCCQEACPSAAISTRSSLIIRLLRKCT